MMDLIVAFGYQSAPRNHRALIVAFKVPAPVTQSLISSLHPKVSLPKFREAQPSFELSLLSIGVRPLPLNLSLN